MRKHTTRMNKIMTTTRNGKGAGPEGPWLDYAGAVERTRLSISYLRKAVMADRIPHRKIGRRVLFRVDELDAWLDGNGGTTPSQEAA